MPTTSEALAGNGRDLFEVLTETLVPPPRCDRGGVLKWPVNARTVILTVILHVLARFQLHTAIGLPPAGGPFHSCESRTTSGNRGRMES